MEQQQQQQPPQAALEHGQGTPDPHWKANLCDCTPLSSCLLGCLLPCILLGRTTSRIKDPTMRTHDELNGDCMIFTAIQCCTGCGWLYNMVKRQEIRELYGIEGSSVGDCCTSFWCLCCALIQQDNEVKLRGPPGPIYQPYQAQNPMQMPHQQPMQQPMQQPPQFAQQPMQAQDQMQYGIQPIQADQRQQPMEKNPTNGQYDNKRQ